jgi:hypothetical protein
MLAFVEQSKLNDQTTEGEGWLNTDERLQKHFLKIRRSTTVGWGEKRYSDERNQILWLRFIEINFRRVHGFCSPLRRVFFVPMFR